MLPLNLYARVRFLPITVARETAGAARTRSSLRPPFLRVKSYANLGTSCRENADPDEPTRQESTITTAARHLFQGTERASA